MELVNLRAFVFLYSVHVLM